MADRLNSNSSDDSEKGLISEKSEESRAQIVGGAAACCGKCFVTCCVIFASLVLLILIGVGCLAVVKQKDIREMLLLRSSTLESRETPHVTMVLDNRLMRNCTRPLGKSRLPCLDGSRYITHDEPVGPLRCYDDASAQTGGVDNCLTTPFELSKNRNGVVIPDDGVYSVHGTVTFYDEITYYIAAHLRVDPADQADCRGDHLCLDRRRRRPHFWLTCLAHNQVNKDNAKEFTFCSVDGIRRFRRGDVVSLQVNQAYRGVSSFHKSTYLYLYRI